MGEIEFTLSFPFLHTIELSLPPPSPPSLAAPCAARGASEESGGDVGYIQHYERDWVYPLFTPSTPFILTIDLRLPPPLHYIQEFLSISIINT